LTSENDIEKLEEKLATTLKDNYKRPERFPTTVNRLKRDVKLSEDIKEIYEYRCQICNVFLITPSGPIAIGAHIKGLGRPHHGPDTAGNMLCLCPNHHEQFDSYAFYIDPATLEIKNLDGFEGKKITTNRKHKINKEFFEYHLSQYKKNH
jgi:Predicted restriction endonuclease